MLRILKSASEGLQELNCGRYSFGYASERDALEPVLAPGVSV